MLKGGMYITCDKNDVIGAACYNSRVIAIAETLNDIPNSDTVTLGAVLQPPYDAVCAELDNDIPQFTALYRKYLYGNVQDRFIVLILAAMYKGYNIIVYIPKDEYEMHFKNVLQEHLLLVYGIVCGYRNRKFLYDSRFDTILLTKFYLYDYIDSKTFLMEYPINVELDINVVNKLVYEFNPYVKVQTPETYNFYFMNYIRSIKATNTFLDVPFIRA